MGNQVCPNDRASSARRLWNRCGGTCSRTTDRVCVPPWRQHYYREEVEPVSPEREWGDVI